jgi:hypothetical protein
VGNPAKWFETKSMIKYYVLTKYITLPLFVLTMTVKTFYTLKF